jgi:thiamine pyrophosphokinase
LKGFDCAGEDGSKPKLSETVHSEACDGHKVSWEYATRVKHNLVYALVVAGGSKHDADRALVEGASLVVAADSGAEFMKQHNLVPDIIVGDFDSSNPDTIDRFQELGVPIVRLERDKDKTDTEVALDLIARKGFETAIVIGATGGRRLDHELANVLLIEHYAKKGLDVILHSQGAVIFGVSGDKHCPGMQTRVFAGNPGDWVTIMPITSRVTGATTANLKFSLNNEVLYRGNTLGVSNEMLGATAGISLASGFALVMIHPR